MSKSTQTEKSLSELDAETTRAAEYRESEYHSVREQLRKIYSPDKKPYYWADKWPSVCESCGGLVANMRSVGYICENYKTCGRALVGG